MKGDKTGIVRVTVSNRIVLVIHPTRLTQTQKEALASLTATEQSDAGAQSPVAAH